LELNGFVTVVEALIFASQTPLREESLEEVFRTWASENGGEERDSRRAVADAVLELNHRYAESGSSFRVRKVSGGYKMYTLPEFHRWVTGFLLERRSARLSPAALETLSIIAYRQPVVKSQIDNIRGVDSEGPLHSLLERGLIKTSGRKEAPGRPYIFRTTPEFLAYFGLNDLSELPPEEELMAALRGPRESIGTVEDQQGFFQEATSVEPAEVSAEQAHIAERVDSSEVEAEASPSEPEQPKEIGTGDQSSAAQ
jgi:segregation and condensation protein B